MDALPRTNGHAHLPALLSKHGLVVTELASMLLRHAPGDRLAPVQVYARRLEASAGTVQAALAFLQSTGAAALDARGRLGTSVRALDYPLLWRLALNRPVICAMPLPYSRRFEGLATGIRAQFSQQTLPLDLRFLRGAAQRMQLLASARCDWALVSRFAAETAAAHGFAVEIVMLLGTESYMSRPVLLVRASDVTGLRDGMRIGVDPQSLDHVYTVRASCRGKHVDLIEIEYSQGLQLLARGIVDATVWSEEDVPVGQSAVAALPLNVPGNLRLAEIGEGALITSRADDAVIHLLRATLDRAALLETQQHVVERLRRPAY